MQVCTSLQTDNHANTSLLSFLQAGCPSCCPINTIKALETCVYLETCVKKMLYISCVLVSSYSFRKFEGTFMYDYHTDCLFCGVQMYVTLKGTDGIGTSWDVSEAALYIMTAVAKDLSP